MPFETALTGGAAAGVMGSDMMVGKTRKSKPLTRHLNYLFIQLHDRTYVISDKSAKGKPITLSSEY
jgi:hypothetical protein